MKKRYVRNESGILPFVITALSFLLCGVSLVIIGIATGLNQGNYVASFTFGVEEELIFAITPFMLAGIGLIFIGFVGSIISLVGYISVYNGKYALKGHMSKGKIISCDSLTHKGHSSLNIEIQYTTEEGEKSILCLESNINNSNLYQVGYDIPIYVNGDYANVNEEELQEDYLKRVNEENNA